MYKFLIINYLAIILLGCQDKPFIFQGSKMKGISFVAPPREVDSSVFQPIKQVNAEWISLMPYGFIKEDEANFFYGNGHQWWGRVAGWDCCLCYLGTPKRLESYDKTTRLGWAWRLYG